MSRAQKIAALLMTVLSGVGIYLFFAFRYPYHLHFQEQYQLFEATWAYFASVASVPGGLADWIGRFLTQFCYYAPAGAAAFAVLLCAVQLLTWAVCQRRTLTVYALSFIPAFLLLAFYCDENALAGGAVALLLSLAAASLILLVRPNPLRHILEIALIPVLYMACGPLVIVYLLVTLIRELSGAGGSSWRAHFSARDTKNQSEASIARIVCFIVLMIAVAVVCPLVAGHIFPYPLDRLYFGVHYYRYHNILPGLLWAAALASVVVTLVSCFRGKPLSGVWPTLSGILTFLVVAALGAFLTLRAADSAKEEWMHYDFMVRMEMWNRIMMTADAKNPDSPKTVSCLNLALAKTGRMPDYQFFYFQNGPEGLLPGFTRDHTSPVATGEIYWQLGMVNTAQRFAFEAQEAIPDFQKSARCYRRLAETNIVNGDWDVARKYLKALHNAPFYRKWADETAALLDKGEIFNKRPALSRNRAWRLKEHDFLFSDTEMDSMLGLLKVENPKNEMALAYLMSWCLLRKDLDRFVECIPMVESATMPKSYQEALLLRWVLTHSDFEGLPDYISPGYAHRISRFLADARAGKTEAEMKEAYGDTYWFYYYYRYRTQAE